VVSFDLTVAVIRSRSWIVNSQATPALLEHERVHFLIAICVGRDLHKDASSVSAASVDALTKALMGLVKAGQQKAQQISDRYDRETKNGAISIQQTAWAARVRSWYSTGIKNW
jgi:hypothetical protein